MAVKDEIHEVVEKVEVDGQKFIDDANLIDSYVVTFVICREAIHYGKKAYRWIKAALTGESHE